MKPDTLCAVAASALVWLLAFPTLAMNKVADKTDFAIFSICRAEQHADIAGGTPKITIESGMGDGGFRIATTSPSAQRWFDYGIKLFHAFYHEDARQAFDNAVAADPTCAMCLWGQALSRGPTQNFDAADDDLKAGQEFARKAQAAAHTEREKILTAAMVTRYSRKQDIAAEREFADQVLKGEAAASLLDTYNDERQPFGKAITEQALANAASMGRMEKTLQGKGARREFLNEQGMIFGATYTSAAVIRDGTPRPEVANPVTDYIPSAWPGARAPHAWVQTDSGRLSTVDLVGNGFVLLAGAKGGAWADAARPLQVKPMVLGDEEPWRDLYGIEADGAVLVRPDGHVGWRSATFTPDPGRVLGAAMDAIHGRA